MRSTSGRGVGCSIFRNWRELALFAIRVFCPPISKNRTPDPAAFSPVVPNMSLRESISVAERLSYVAESLRDSVRVAEQLASARSQTPTR